LTKPADSLALTVIFFVVFPPFLVLGYRL